MFKIINAKGFHKFLLPLLIILVYAHPPHIYAGDQIWTSEGPLVSSHLYSITIGKDNQTVYTSGYSGVWKSSNRGSSWIKVSDGIPTPYDVNSIRVDPSYIDVVYGGTYNAGLFKTTNGGNSWVYMGLSTENIRWIELDPNNGQIIYVGTNTTIYKSVDGGFSWVPLSLGTTGVIGFIQIDPINTHTIYTTIVGGTPFQGLYKSDDSGITWSRIHDNIIYAVPTINPQILYGVENGRLLRSSNGGSSWTQTNGFGLPPGFQILSRVVDSKNPEIIFANSSGYGVYRSNDGGNSWDPLNEGLNGNVNFSSLWELVMDKDDPRTLYMSTINKGIWQYTLPRTPTSLTPIILLPGLGASWNHEGMILRIEKTPEEWYMTPGVRIYNGLIQTLKNSGYQTEGENRNLFIFNYDWRKPIDSLADDLKNYIDNVVNLPEGITIDLIGHSLGGIVGRAYLQKNPESHQVDQLITLGSPHKGATQVYYLWEGAEFSRALSGWQRIGVGILLQLNKNTFENSVETLHKAVPVLKDILPTFPYLIKNSQQIPIENMKERNEWLDNLNKTLSSALLSFINTFVGNSFDTPRWIGVEERSQLDKLLGRWVDGKPTGEKSFVSGDKTVLAESARLEGANVINLENIDHGDLVEKTEAQQAIVNLLGLSPTGIGHSPAIDYEPSLVFQLASAANFSISGPNGWQIGEGVGNNIPNGVYSYPDKLIFIPGAVEGKYQVRIQKENQGGEYRLLIGQITENGDVWQEFQGNTIQEETKVYTINFDPTLLTTKEAFLILAKNKLESLKKEAEKRLAKPVNRIFNYSLNRNIRQIERALWSLRKNKAELAKKQMEVAIFELNQIEKSLSLWRKIHLISPENETFFVQQLREAKDYLIQAHDLHR